MVDEKNLFEDDENDYLHQKGSAGYRKGCASPRVIDFYYYGLEDES